jgi:hypothetical protein
MPRYNKVRTINYTINDPLSPYDKTISLKRNIKYPEIPRDFSDIYVYVTRGDRYDTLAFQYYEDSSLWWIIHIANYMESCDSLIPTPGSQIRITSVDRVSSIILSYETLNNI